MPSELANFLQNTHWPQVPERRPTFFSIAKFPHYENVMSNVYQFFFSTENPHGLGSLCIDALGDILKSKRPEMMWSEHAFRLTQARRELRTGNEKRLDILLHNGPDEDEWQTAGAIVLIENKIFHWLANDLGNYWDFVESRNSTSSRVGIVLGLKHEIIPPQWRDKWVTITHLEWAKAVENRLGPLVYKAESRYLTLLFELIENIRTMTNANESFGQMLALFQNNREAISRAEQIRKELFFQVPVVVRAALSSKYIVEAGEKGDGWLTIYGMGSQPLKYILSYYEVFYKDEVSPNYRITLMVDKDTEPAADWCSKLLTTQAEQRGLQKSAEPNGILEKVYQLSSTDYKRFSQLISDNLHNDWELLEPLWLNRTASETAE